MRKWIIAAALVLAVSVSGFAQTDVTPVEIGSVAFYDSTAATFLAVLIPAAGIRFPNDDRTFVVLFDSTGTEETLTVAKPATTINIEGYGTVTLSNITVVMTPSPNRNFAIVKIPMRYNVNGKVTITASGGNRVKAGVFKLSKY